MKAIKVLLLVSVLGMFTLSSCKKHNTPVPAATRIITATIDGTATVFTTSVTATGTINGYKLIQVQGDRSDGSVINITMKGQLINGETFTSNDPDPGGAPDLFYITGGKTYENGIDNPSVNAKIIDISPTHVQGTFSGTITERTSGQAIVITDGKFDVPIP